jgi:hypothetical protein
VAREIVARLKIVPRGTILELAVKARAARDGVYQRAQLFHVEQLCWPAQVLVGICEVFGLTVRVEAA